MVALRTYLLQTSISTRLSPLQYSIYTWKSVVLLQMLGVYLHVHDVLQYGGAICLGISNLALWQGFLLPGSHVKVFCDHYCYATISTMLTDNYI